MEHGARYNVCVDHIKKHLQQPRTHDKRTERGELMKYFLERINASRVADGFRPITMGHMGRLLQKIPTKDLYYLKRVCDDAPNFSKKFWWEIDPKKHSDTSKPF